MKHLYAILIMGFFNLNFFGGGTKEDAFWRWFEKNEERLFAFEKNREAVFEDLSSEMKKVNPDLTFEFGPVSKDGYREFVISAGGIKTAFASVETLFTAAPKMQRWKFIKFRPRRTPIGDLNFGGKTVRAGDVHYLLFKDERAAKVGIMVFLDGYKEDEKRAFAEIGYLLLDQALGEYDVETKVGAIVFQSRESKHFAQAHPLAELPKDFDDYFADQKK